MEFLVVTLVILIIIGVWATKRTISRSNNETQRLYILERQKEDELRAQKKSLKEAAASKEWLKKHNSLHREDVNQSELLARANFEKRAREVAKMFRDRADAEQASMESSRLEFLREMTKEENVESWLEQRKRPTPQALGVSARGAEQLAALWLKYLGEEKVEVTQETGDGGVDVLSANFCCQVKNYKKQPVTSSEVRDLYGTAHSMSLKPLMMTSSYLSQDALDWASRNEVAAIKFDAEEGTLTSLNNLGESLLVSGKYRDQ